MSALAATKRIVVASALAFACTGFAPAAQASVAHCHVTVYVQFSQASYSSTGSELPSCVGQIGNQLVAAGGSVATTGSYRPQMLSSGRCGLALETQSFEADLPSALGFFENPTTNVTGRLTGMSAGAVSALFGSASAEGIPLSVRGTGILSPGAGQSCAGVSSGTLDEDLLLSDGSGVAPADAPAELATPAASGSAPERAATVAPAAKPHCPRRVGRKRSCARRRHRKHATPGYSSPRR
jgi:hypothetical protein